MMAILTLELRGAGDGTAWLNFWDVRGGNDTVLRLFPDGSTRELSFGGDPEDETEVWSPVDLVARLLELCEEKVK